MQSGIEVLQLLAKFTGCLAENSFLALFVYHIFTILNMKNSRNIMEDVPFLDTVRTIPHLA
jgi:hypothetical protein